MEDGILGSTAPDTKDRSHAGRGTLGQPQGVQRVPSSCRAWSTCEGVKVKMRESERANKAETRKKPVGQEVGERAGRARRGHSREHLPANRSQHTCVYRRQCRPVAPVCVSVPRSRLESTEVQSRVRESRLTSVSVRGPPASSPHQRVSRDGSAPHGQLPDSGLDESYLSEHRKF